MTEGKRIGDYLIEENVCDEKMVREALERQAELIKKGIFKPLGSIMVDSIGIAFKDVDNCLRRMHIDALSSAALFKDMPRDSIEKTVSFAEQQVIPKDTVIFNQGDDADTFCVVISGKVRVYLISEDGEETTLTTLGAGEGFGEMALLTGEPRSASVITVEPTSLLVLSKNYFDQLCAVWPELARAFIKILANRVMHSNVGLASAQDTERAYKEFVSQHGGLSSIEIIGQPRSIKGLLEAVDSAAQSEHSVLIQGETGTEKITVASAIHKKSSRSQSLFLTMDAQNIMMEGIPAGETSNELYQEISQSSAIFGHQQGAFSFARTRRLGLLQICREGSLMIDNVEHLAPAVQEKLAEFLKTGMFQAIGGREPVPSNTRLFVTTSADLKKLVEEKKFSANLFDLLKEHVLTISPLRKRKRDLRLLSEDIIRRRSLQQGKTIKGIDERAYQRIMSYDWPGNLRELSVVLNRAISLAQHEYLMPEDIFIGMAPPQGKHTFNLFRIEKFSKLFNSRWWPGAAQAVTGVVFSAIFLMAFLGSTSSDSNISLIMVWALWWPMMVLSWFVGARIWCSVCPMGAVNDLMNHFCSLKKKVPMFIRNYGVYISAAGLGIIILVEAASGMVYSPQATGFLLLAITLFALLSGFLFERRVWCRYLCPLGRLGAVFSSCSMIEWRSNNSICNSICTANSCFKGRNNIRGCPLYQGAFSIKSNQNCILCGNCVKACENNSPTCSLRVPGHELWSFLQPDRVIFVFVPVIMGTQLFRGLEHTALFHAVESTLQARWLPMTILLVVMTALAYLYVRISSSFAVGKLDKTDCSENDLYVHSIIPLLFAFELGYHLKILLSRAGNILPVLGRQIGINLEFLGFAGGLSAAKPWQVLLILAGTAASGLILLQLIKRHRQTDEPVNSFRRCQPLILLAVLYIWMFIR